ncbi:hypothetical protein SESBI_00995 [Sesbania bispinosa]|nr:hypothetical protein SESBI_00995 [Sesbania bispinosa]
MDMDLSEREKVTGRNLIAILDAFETLVELIDPDDEVGEESKGWGTWQYKGGECGSSATTTVREGRAHAGQRSVGRRSRNGEGFWGWV